MLFFCSDSKSANIINLPDWQGGAHTETGVKRLGRVPLKTKRSPGSDDWWYEKLKNGWKSGHSTKHQTATLNTAAAALGKERKRRRQARAKWLLPSSPSTIARKEKAPEQAFQASVFMLHLSVTYTTWSNLSKWLHRWARRASFNSLEKQQTPQHLA